jgi:sugar-phosphatase
MCRSSVSERRYSALLFDMDGTILNSIASAERIWGRWAKSHGLDVETFVPTVHGARAFDTIARLDLPGVDPQTEALLITQEEIADVDGIIEVPGASIFLRSLPNQRWAIVTSAPKALAIRRIEAAGIPMPTILVTSEDVSDGKPNPACYLLAAQRLGVEATECLVFEDAVAGILAGETAGADVIVVTATHTRKMTTRHAVIGDYKTLRANVDEHGFVALEELTSGAPPSKDI